MLHLHPGDHPCIRLACCFLLLLVSSTFAADPTSKPAADVSKFPHIHVDMVNKQIRIDAEMINCRAPLEFLPPSSMAETNMNRYPHAGPAVENPPRPAHARPTAGRGRTIFGCGEKWFPPQGPPLNITCEFEKDGKKVVVPAYRMMRDLATQKEMPPMTWIFVGWQVMDDGNYAADVAGYVVSIVNFELTLIDIPDLASSANETLEWEINWDVAPPAGTPVTMIIEPAGKVESLGSAPPVQAGSPTTQPLSDVSIDQPKVDHLVQLWTQKVAPHDAALRAAQADAETITALRREQQRLIDEADRIQRTIDDLEKKYQDVDHAKAGIDDDAEQQRPNQRTRLAVRTPPNAPIRKPGPPGKGFEVSTHGQQS